MAGSERTGRRAMTAVCAAVGAVALLTSAVVVAAGMSDLRGAYLYRESSGEGIALAQVAMRLTGGGTIALVGVGALFLGSKASAGRQRTVLRMVAWEPWPLCPCAPQLHSGCPYRAVVSAPAVDARRAVLRTERHVGAAVNRRLAWQRAGSPGRSDPRPLPTARTRSAASRRRAPSAQGRAPSR